MRDKEKHRETCRRWAKNNPEICRAKSRRSYFKNHARRLERRRFLYAANPDRQKEASREYAEAHREECRKRCREYHDKNRDKLVSACREYYAANREEQCQKSREWARNNPDKANAIKKLRRARRKNQLHTKADPALIAKFYALATVQTEATGQKHHVDHIIPLCHGGWHHQDNLQVLPWRVNQRKGDDPVWEETGYKCWRDVPCFLWPVKLGWRYTRLMV